MLKITKFFSILIVLLLSLNCNSQVLGVGINTNDPKSTLDINGNLSVKEIGTATPLYGGPSGNATPINDGVYISITPRNSDNDFKLPFPTTVPGRIYIIRNVSSTNTAYLLIDGTPFANTGRFYAKDSSSPTPTTGTPVISMPANALFKTLILISDGANWTYFF